MKELNSRIRKLERRTSSNKEEIVKLVNESNLTVLQKTKILCDAGIITGEMIAGWIKEGAKNR